MSARRQEAKGVFFAGSSFFAGKFVLRRIFSVAYSCVLSGKSAPPAGVCGESAAFVRYGEAGAGVR